MTSAERDAHASEVEPGAPQGGADKEVSRQYRLLSSELKVLGVEHEYRLSRYAVYLLAVALLISLWVAFTVHLQLGLILAGMSGAAALYYRLVVPRLLLRSGYPERVRLLNVTLEVSLPSVASLVDIGIMGGGYALTSTVPLLSFLVVTASGLRLSRRLSLYAGALAALQYLAVYAVARGSFTPELAASLPTLRWDYALMHAAYLVLAGLLAALIADVVKVMTGRVVDQVVEKERVYDRFGEYVAENPVNLVLDDQALQQGVRREVTVLYSDIRDFTHLTYRVDATAVVSYLNAYFGRVCDVIVKNGGIVDKFTGDGCLALFGALDARSNHALRAARAALQLLEVVKDLPRPDGEQTSIGIGLATGEVLVGSIGAPGRRDYTAIGDTVNLAARIEALTRELGKDVVLTGAVVGAAGGSLQTNKLGRFEIRGRDGAIGLHELVRVRSVTDTMF